MEVSGQFDASIVLFLWRAPDIHWIGPMVDLDAVEKRRIPCPCSEIELQYLSRLALVAMLTTLLYPHTSSRRCAKLSTGTTLIFTYNRFAFNVFANLRSHLLCH
jgi:hypothetical protein